MSERKAKLLNRLRKGLDKTTQILGSLSDEQWTRFVYREPYPWTVRDLLAHFVSAEEGLLLMAQDIGAGGRGSPDGFDYNAMNAVEQERLADIPASDLLTRLAHARQETIRWVEGLDEADLDREGYHPALGEITLEVFINAIYGHQLMHMRDLMAVLE